MYQYRGLDGIGLEQLTDCFNLAFSDYEQPMQFTPERFGYYLTASAVDLSLSFGAFYGEELVGFILNSGGIYNDLPVVFDAGTGVVPAHRGKKVFSGLFGYTAQKLQDRGIAKYHLEVLQSNDHAISIYSKVGFHIQREFTVLAASGARENWDKEVPCVPYSAFSAFQTAHSVAPSYEHTTHIIDKNPELYEVLYAENRAYCIYAKRNGAILQMHYSDPEALADVLSALIRRYPAAWAKNVDCQYNEVLQVLENLGFKEVTKQYEMARDISAII